MISGFLAPDRGTIMLGEGDDAVDITPALGRGAGRGSDSAVRSRTVACSRPHGARRRSRSRSSATSTCAIRSSAALHLPWVSDAEDEDRRNVERAPRAARHHRLPRQARPRALDRQPAHRRPRVRARARTVRAAARRAVLRHRATRGRGARPAAAAHPRQTGRDACS